MRIKFNSLIPKQKLMKKVVLCLTLFLLICFPWILIQEGFAADPDFAYLLEGFEGNFVQQTGYGEIPSGWLAVGPQNVTFSEGLDPHDGVASLQAVITYHPTDYSGILKIFYGQPGAILNLRIQVQLSTSGQAASAGLRASSGLGFASTTTYWSSSSIDWVTLTLENVEVPSNGELLIVILVGHDDQAGGSTDFDLDCLTSDVTIDDEPPPASGGGGGGGGCFIATAAR